MQQQASQQQKKKLKVDLGKCVQMYRAPNLLNPPLPGSSLPSGSTAASMKSEFDSIGYITLLIFRKLLVFKSFGSMYLPVDQE